jgi:hypothetical protein
MKIKPFWKYLLSGIVVLAISTGGYFGYQAYRSMKQPALTAMQAVPPNTALFIETGSPMFLMQKLSHASPFWTELTAFKSIAGFQQDFNKFDSLLYSSLQLRSLTESARTISCICNGSNASSGILLITQLPATGYETIIRNFITRVNGEKSIVMQKKSGKASVSIVNIPGFKKFFCYSVYKGLLIASFDEPFVSQAISQIESGVAVNADENFKKLEITAGKNVDANVYVNYLEFSKFAAAISNQSSFRKISRLAGFAQWTGADLIMKPDELYLNGYTLTKDSGKEWLGLLDQEPQTILVTEILPYDVNFMVHIGLADFSLYQETLDKYRRKTDSNDRFDSIRASLKKILGADIETEFYSWTGHEVALCEATPPGSVLSRKYVVVHASDIIKAKESLGRLSAKATGSDNGKPFDLQYEDYLIQKLDVPGLFPLLYGELFEGLSCPYYTAFRDYIVFSDSPESLTKMISDFYNQKTLSANINFSTFSDNISEKSNLFLYCNIRNSIPRIVETFNNQIANEIMTNQAAVRNFEGLALQFSRVSDMFYTSIYLKYNPSYVEETPSGWTAEISGNVAGKPSFTRNEETGKLNIVLFDDQNNMYLLDNSGKIIWKTPLIEPPLSRVFSLEVEGAGKKQYLFNTRNYIYLIDPSGNYSEGFPVKLKAEATNGMNVIDFEGNRDYRVLLALSDNRVYNFDIGIKPVEGWEKVSASQKVSAPVQYLSVDGKDYLFITDDGGNVIVVNRKGESRMKLKKGFRKGINSEFFVNQTNNKGKFITTDTEGKFVYIYENGKTDQTNFGKFSDNHFFLYEDFMQNGSPDFIFLDQNKLKIFDRLKKQIFEFEFPEDVKEGPLYFKGMRDDLILGVESAGKIFLFNKDGQVYDENNFSGNTPFIVGSLNSDGKLNLITGNGNKVMNYVLE